MTGVRTHSLSHSRAVAQIEAICASTIDERALRAEVVAVLGQAIGFDAYVWLLTDPMTSVGSAPLADVPCLPQLQPAPTGQLTSQWRDLLQDNDIVDVASLVFRDRYGCWGFLDLWRGSGRGTFGTEDLGLVGATIHAVTAALRLRLAATFAAGPVAPPIVDGPAVLILDDDLQITDQTSAATQWLERLLPTMPGVAPIPPAALNVAAQLLATEAGVDANPAMARTHVAGLTWVTLRASRLAGRPGGVQEHQGAIAVSIEVTPAGPRLDVFARTHALTEREGDLLRLLARGLDTRELAKAMAIKGVTVHDHLKSIFAKTSLNTRTAVLTAAMGADRE